MIIFFLCLFLFQTTFLHGAPVVDVEHADIVARHFTKVAERRAKLFSRAAAAQRHLDRHRSVPPPSNAYVYGDKESTWDHTQALVDWAEGRPHTREAKRAARQQERSVHEAAALLELPTNGDRASSLLRSWRLHIQDKIDVQEEKRRNHATFQNNIARTQLALSGTEEENHMQDNKQRIDDVVTMLLSTKDAAKRVKKVAEGRVATANMANNMVNNMANNMANTANTKGTSFLETMSKGKVLVAGGDQTCIMCLYFMERLEQKVGNPSHDLHGNDESTSTSGSTYPGPAGYERGAVESQPQYSPIPGPGYSSGSLLQIGEKNPAPPASNPNDYQTLISNDNNLKQRLRANYNNEPKERRKNSEEEAQTTHLVEDLKSMGVGDVQFLDTGALAQDRVGAGVPASKSALVSMQEADATTTVDPTAAQKTTNALAAEYDAAHDPYLGLRPEDQQQAPPTTALLELRAKQKRAKSTAKGFVASLASVAGGMAAGAAASLGAGINCPEGMPFCRKALRRVGRRSLSRRERRAVKNKEMSDTMNMMQDAVDEMRKDVAKYGGSELNTFSSQLQKIASEYLHDYSDEEICSDINMCSVGQNPGQLPIAKSAFSLIRL